MKSQEMVFQSKKCSSSITEEFHNSYMSDQIEMIGRNIIKRSVE